MPDRLETIQGALHNFQEDRDVLKQNDSNPLAVAILLSGEAAELIEALRGIASTGIESQDKAVRQELADVLIYALTLAQHLGIDVYLEVMEKIARNMCKYPADMLQDGDYATAVAKCKQVFRETRGNEDFYRE